MKMPKITVIGENELFPWKLGDTPVCEEFEPLPENLHKLVLDKTKYIIQINSSKFHGNEAFIECYITNNFDTGVVAFKLTYE
jgi:hypothetical protein